MKSDVQMQDGGAVASSDLLGGICPQCGKQNAIVNQCGCDPNNMPTKLPVSERVHLADRLADYVRMFFEANPPMPDAIAVAWRDYQDGRNSPNKISTGQAPA